MTAKLPEGTAHPTGVPCVGDVFWLDTDACYGHDIKPTRPAVVLRGAIFGVLPEVLVLVRTSAEEFSSAHVKHPKNLTVGLDRDGIFPKIYQRRVDQRFFNMPAHASYQGKLDEPHLTLILKMMGLL